MSLCQMSLSAEQQSRIQKNTGSRPRKRRARVVCIQCHNRKLKCDLELRSKSQLKVCSNCSADNVECRQRVPARHLGRSQRALQHNEEAAAQDNPYPAIQPMPAPSLPLSSEESIFHPDSMLAPRSELPAQPVDHADIESLTNQVQEGITPVCMSQPTPSLQRPLMTITDADIDGPPTAASEPAYLGETGILPIFVRESRAVALSPRARPTSRTIASDIVPLALQESFVESYFEYCWTWCPVLDYDTLRRSVEESPSALLLNALALLGVRIRPPLIQHDDAADYYERAKTLFYTDKESDPVVCLQSIMLFYWWAPQSPNVVHKDAAWWWTGLAIRYAQQLGLHHEPRNVQHIGGEVVQGLRRRIWWTLFARERLTSICQGRPCTINPDDCTVREPTLGDFPKLFRDQRASIFIHWVRLCGIVGKVSQHLSRSRTRSFPVALGRDLINWIREMPAQLQLPIGLDRTKTFHRDVHKLYLPYLTTITVLHMNPSSQQPEQTLPQAHTAAISSASCVARIFKDLLARGHIRFLGAIATWYVSVAIVALLPTGRIERLSKSGRDDIRVLRAALGQLKDLWPTASLFIRGFERLQAFRDMDGECEAQRPPSNRDSAYDEEGGGQVLAQGEVEEDIAASAAIAGAASTNSPPLSDLNWTHGIDWHDYFPFATEQTSELLGLILAEEHQMDEFLADSFWSNDPTAALQDMFDAVHTLPNLFSHQTEL